ncbi:hypothetical protein [Pseudomonas sp. L1(2025)]|uniref:hypothetical protein n=1 Tax=Pseudomonas sp. L1(2025) TaxID=3449429 RepID=UPI003F68D49B
MIIKLSLAGMALMALAGIAQADTATCPPVSTIKATPYTDPNPQIPDGYEYKAPGPAGQTWEGQSPATLDTYLEPKYQLGLVGAKIANGKVFCLYGGTAEKEKAEPADKVSRPFIKLQLSMSGLEKAEGTQWNNGICGAQEGADALENPKRLSVSDCSFKYTP